MNKSCKYVIGGAGIFDSILHFLTFTSQTAKEAAKHVGKAALEAGKTVAVDAGKKLIDKAMQPKKKVEDIISKYTANHSRLGEKTKQVGSWAERDIKNKKNIVLKNDI